MHPCVVCLLTQWHDCTRRFRYKGNRGKDCRCKLCEGEENPLSGLVINVGSQACYDISLSKLGVCTSLHVIYIVCMLEFVIFAGVCLGMQIAVIEFARNVLGWKDAQSTEFDSNTSHPVVRVTLASACESHGQQM